MDGSDIWTVGGVHSAVFAADIHESLCSRGLSCGAGLSKTSPLVVTGRWMEGSLEIVKAMGLLSDRHLKSTSQPILFEQCKRKVSACRELFGSSVWSMKFPDKQISYFGGGSIGFSTTFWEGTGSADQMVSVFFLNQPIPDVTYLRLGTGPVFWFRFLNVIWRIRERYCPKLCTVS